MRGHIRKWLPFIRNSGLESEGDVREQRPSSHGWGGSRDPPGMAPDGAGGGARHAAHRPGAALHAPAYVRQRRQVLWKVSWDVDMKSVAYWGGRGHGPMSPPPPPRPPLQPHLEKRTVTSLYMYRAKFSANVFNLWAVEDQKLRLFCLSPPPPPPPPPQLKPLKGRWTMLSGAI